jgi:hypothetical protein
MMFRSTLSTCRSRSDQVSDPDPFLHIAMQIGLYHPRRALHGSSQLGVQSLRILPIATNHAWFVRTIESLSC